MLDSKRCIGCDCVKPRSEFYASKSKDVHQARCKTCWDARVKAWKADNPERAAESSRKRTKAYIARNLDEVRAKERAKYKSDLDAGRYAVRQKKKRNPATYSANNRRREQVKRRAMPAWADDRAIHSVYQACVERTRITGLPHHVDHIVPLRSKLVCGLHVEHNLRVVPSVENMRKSNRHWPDMA